MFSSLRSLIVWVLASTISLNIASLVSASSYAMSIGDLIVRDTTFLDTTGQESGDFPRPLVHSSPSTHVTNGAQQNPGTGREVTVVNVGSYSKPMSSNSQRIFKAKFNDNGNGYNISLPGWLCADLVLGDWEAPDGTQIVNGSIGDLAKQMRLPSKALHNYTYTRAAALLESINSTFTDVLCEPDSNSGRQLLYNRWRTQDVEGYWETYLLSASGVIGIALLGLRLGIIHEGITANITLQTQVYILAATGTLEYLCVTTLWRLQTNGFIPRGEALILNAVWTLGEKIRDNAGWAWTGSCAGASTFAGGIRALGSQALSHLRVLNPSRLRHGEPSTLDLISQMRDVENGNGGGGMMVPDIGEQCTS